MNFKYFKNVKPFNNIKLYSKGNLSDEFNCNYNKDVLNNIILNSNLDNEKLIK